MERDVEMVLDELSPDTRVIKSHCVFQQICSRNVLPHVTSLDVGAYSFFFLLFSMHQNTPIIVRYVEGDEFSTGIAFCRFKTRKTEKKNEYLLNRCPCRGKIKKVCAYRLKENYCIQVS
jgi:hypothetical protein